jgi:hypothetical protein
MFEVYLNDRRNLLVVQKGTPLPLDAVSGKWRKTKKKVLRVSDEIRSAVQKAGVLRAQAKRCWNGGLGPEEMARNFGHVQPLQHHH